MLQTINMILSLTTGSCTVALRHTRKRLFSDGYSMRIEAPVQIARREHMPRYESSFV